MLARRIAAIAVLFAVWAAGACDTAERTIPSHFEPAQPEFFTVTGRVRRGDELVPGAIVRVDATAVDAGVLTVVTNGDGFYRFANAPPRYDLHVVTGHELTSFLGVGLRNFEPLLAGSASAHGYSAHVAVTLVPAPAADAKVVFSVSGTDVLGVSGDLARGVDVAFRNFAMTTADDAACTNGVMLHAVAVAPSGSLAEPTAYGKSCLSLNAGGLVSTSIAMTPIDAAAIGVIVQSKVPAGLADEPVEILLDFGLRYLALHVASLPLGGAAKMVRIPDARYALRVRARGGAASSDSGHFYFEPDDVVIRPVLPPPPSVRGPLVEGGRVSFEVDADGGARELALVAADAGATTVRVVTTDAAIAPTDPRSFGLAAMRGKYTWSVRHWPKLPFSDSVGGTEARETYASASVEGGPFDAP